MYTTTFSQARASPHQYEAAEEWLLVLEGRSPRAPDASRRRGATSSLSGRPAGAHKPEPEMPARMMMFSNGRVPGVCGSRQRQIAVWAGDEADELTSCRTAVLH